MKEHYWVPGRAGRLSIIAHHPEPFREASPVVVFCHGFTGDKVGANQLMLNLAKTLEHAGISAVRFDFAGSGESEGEFARDTLVSGWREDLRRVLAWVKKQDDFSASPLFLAGHSLGGLIVLCHDDAWPPVAGRIALAPVVHAAENFRDTILGPELWAQAVAGQTIANFYNKGFSLGPGFVAELLTNAFDPLAVAERQTSPLLLIHGDADAAVPLRGSKELFHRYHGPKEFRVLEQTDHVFAGRHDLVGRIIADWVAAVAETMPRG